LLADLRAVREGVLLKGRVGRDLRREEVRTLGVGVRERLRKECRRGEMSWRIEEWADAMLKVLRVGEKVKWKL
jgi:hypothetical protein